MISKNPKLLTTPNCDTEIRLSALSQELEAAFEYFDWNKDLEQTDSVVYVFNQDDTVTVYEPQKL